MNLDEITLGSVQACVRALYDGDPVPSDVVDMVAKECHRGFNAFSLQGGVLTLYFGDGGSMELMRGFNRKLTDEEVHFLATEHEDKPPKFDPDNILYTIKVLGHGT